MEYVSDSLSEAAGFNIFARAAFKMLQIKQTAEAVQTQFARPALKMLQTNWLQTNKQTMEGVRNSICSDLEQNQFAQ